MKKGEDISISLLEMQKSIDVSNLMDFIVALEKQKRYTNRDYWELLLC